MDYKFPSQLFPGFYNRGPPDAVHQHCAGSWGSYDRVLPLAGAGDLSSWTFTSRHQVKGEAWSPTEPLPVPLLSPKHAVSWPLTPPDPVSFLEHMQNFYTDHHQEAFGCMAEILGQDFNFQKKKYQLHSGSMQKMRRFLDTMQFEKCELAHSSQVKDAYCAMLTEVMHTIPADLLGSLLHEELTEQRRRMLSSEDATGGALATLDFHMVALRHHPGGPSGVDAKSSDLFSFQLKGPIRQISTASLFDHCCAAVRSDRLCGAWRFSERDRPRLLQVLSTAEVATCASASPHLLGEVLVASEGGAAALWTLGRGIQKIREEDQNLYFNARSPWRWCEFAAHPRVMLYADRTGAELSDIREKPATTHTLFQISKTSECRGGERLSLCRYLGLAQPFHHLITTQYSAYIVDERFAAMPMIKWDHLLRAAPVFCHVVPGSCGGGSKTTKILLGAHRSQEIVMLQYSGGDAEAGLSWGPPRFLHRPRDSLDELPVQIPHRRAAAEDRLSSPALGLTCMQKTGSPAEECLCVLQLTEAGDVFYQILQPGTDDARGPDTGTDGRRPVSGGSLSAWKRWLAKLRRRRGQPGPRAPQHVLEDGSDLLVHCWAAGVPDERVDTLRLELSTRMRERSLLLSASLGAPEPPALPDPVDADAWTDALSRRLTASWQGEEAWRSWWREELGLDRQRKVEELRRRRRREKEARRAGRRHPELSDSFSSSFSGLSDWNELSDSASRAPWSDTESVKSQRSQEPPPPPPAESPAASCPALPSQTPAVPPARKRSRDTLDCYLSSLLPPQDDDAHEPPPLSFAASLHPQSSASRVDLSQDRPGLSQSSQRRSQSSQPPRRSQMGF